MKKLVAFLFAAVSLVLTVVADPSVTVSSMVKTKYLGQFGEYFSKDPVLQNDLFIAYESGLWLDLWNSVGLTTDLNSGFDDETDFGIGRSGELPVINSLGEISYDVGAYYFNIHETSRFDKSDIVQLHLEVQSGKSLTMTYPGANLKLTPYFRVNVLRDMGNGEVVNFEPLTFVGVKTAVTLSEKMSVNGKVAVSYDPGILGGDPGVRLTYEQLVSMQLTESLTFHPFGIKVIYSAPSGDANWNASVGASYKF